MSKSVWSIIEVNTDLGVFERPAVVLGPCALTWDWTREAITITHLATGFKLGLRIEDVAHGEQYLKVLANASSGIWSSDLRRAAMSIKSALVDAEMFNLIDGKKPHECSVSDFPVLPVNLIRLAGSTQ